jgi:hypothetical protein
MPVIFTPATPADIAEAVSDALNAATAGTFTPTFTAKRVYVPVIEPAKVGTTLQVLVVARAQQLGLASRTRPDKDVAVDIGIQKRLTQLADPAVEAANTELDALMTFTAQVLAYFAPSTSANGREAVATATGAVWHSSGNDPIYSIDHLREHRVFTSVLTLNFRIP